MFLSNSMIEEFKNNILEFNEIDNLSLLKGTIGHSLIIFMDENAPIELRQCHSILLFNIVVKYYFIYKKFMAGKRMTDIIMNVMGECKENKNFQATEYMMIILRIVDHMYPNFDPNYHESLDTTCFLNYALHTYFDVEKVVHESGEKLLTNSIINKI